jgi:Leucine-rich repeat (LRR) protein
VTITNPQNGQTVSGTVTIQAQVTERSKKTKAPSGIAKVEFYIDNNKVGEDTSSPYEYSWNTTQYTDGTHTITAKAYDNAGNVGESPVISVTISAPVTFADPNLEQAVRNTLGIPGGQPITRADMTRLTSLNAESKSIRSLSGLEYAINLQDLYLESNQINDINPLANLNNLQELHLGRNQISDISPLANLTNLQKLDLDYNQISDISPLANLTNLQELVLDYNQISDISPLANLINLQELNLWLNQISDINPLANLTNLQKLVLGENQISDISPLVSNTGLGQGDYVNLEYNLLNLTPGSDDMQNIQILQNRGVTVYY